MKKLVCISAEELPIMYDVITYYLVTVVTSAVKTPVSQVAVLSFSNKHK